MNNTKRNIKPLTLLLLLILFTLVVAILSVLLSQYAKSAAADTVIPSGTNFTLSKTAETDNRIDGKDGLSITYNGSDVGFTRQSDGTYEAYAYPKDAGTKIQFTVHNLVTDYNIGWQGSSTVSGGLTTRSSMVRVRNYKYYPNYIESTVYTSGEAEISGKTIGALLIFDVIQLNYVGYYHDEIRSLTQLLNHVERYQGEVLKRYIIYVGNNITNNSDYGYASIDFHHGSATYKLNDGSAQNYSANTQLTDEGKYDITVTSSYFNNPDVKVSYTHYVDRTPPALMHSAEYSNTTANVTWSVGKYELPVTATYTYNGINMGAYSSGTVLSEEGTYTIYARDEAGNIASLKITIDKTPPHLSYPEYTRDPFTVSASDGLSGMDKLEIQQDGKWQQYNGQQFSENGAYSFRATDKSGNTSEASVTLYRTDTFGNAASIRDGYKTTSWYVVTLPARIFTTPNKDDAGRYSFESYADALEFAMIKEREYRVAEVQGGYMYISPANETIAQKYTDELTLADAIDKYARKYISDRRTASENGRDNLYIELTSLTRNSPTVPSFISSNADYSTLAAYFLKRDAAWSLPNIKYLNDLPYSITATYLGDVAAAAPASFNVTKNVTLQTALGDSYMQGWYLITESDECGNVEKYLVYSDAELPTIYACVGYGNDTTEKEIDYTFTVNEPTYFTSFEFKALNDNADDYITLKLEKGSNVYYFTQSDMLPTLGSDEFDCGKYTVTVFDRSLNTLKFDVFIAGDEPTMTHSSLASDKAECRVTFSTPDRYSVITEITLYKLEYDGSKTMLKIDGAGTSINAATLSYVLTVGGKYSATVTDNYGRVIEFSPIFFLKGLPSGKLTGVKDGGRTNKNVSVSFDTADVCELYVLLPGGARQTFTNYAVQTGATQTVFNITADDTTSHEYLVYLRNAADPSLFIEYTFEIDTILPDFEITDRDGNAIQPDGATNKPFSIKWNEANVYVRYYTARGNSFSATKYNMNTVLSQGTLYYFTLTDEIGNSLEFTVLLDNAIDYTLSGTFNTVDGVLYTNKPLTFTVNEPVQNFSAISADGRSMTNGDTLTIASRYEINVTDNYGNTVKLAIVLDFTPPTLQLVGAKSNNTVNTEVSVIASDFDTLFLADSRGRKIRDVRNGEVFSEQGTYYVIATDNAGNTASAAFSIDLEAEYTLSVPNGAITTSTVTLSSDETLFITVVKDGVEIDTQTKFTEHGFYELTIVDAYGNTSYCVFCIVPSRAQSYSIAFSLGTSIIAATRDGESVELPLDGMLVLDNSGKHVIMLNCMGESIELELEVDNTPPLITLEKSGSSVKIVASDKENVTLELTKDGSLISGRIGQTFDKYGHYVLTVTDDLGNVAVYEFEVPYRLNSWAIVAIVVAVIAFIALLILVIRARCKPRLK